MTRGPALITAAVVFALAACAPGPDAIRPVSMGSAYAGITCRQAANMLAVERQTLAALEDKQRGAVVGDAISVFLIGVPVASLTGGDVQGELSTSKGKVLALEARLFGCGN